MRVTASDIRLINLTRIGATVVNIGANAVAKEFFNLVILDINEDIAVFAVLEWYTMQKSGNVSGFVYAGVSGAMINTIIVMGGIYVLYKDAYAEKLEIDPGAVLGVIGGVISFNGVVESIVAAIIVAALGVVLNKLKPIQK